MSPFSEDKRQSHGSSYSWPGFCAWADMVKEAEDLHKNHSQRGATSPAYLQTQTEIKGLTLHNAQNKPDCTCRILIANWQDPKWSTKAKVFCIQNKKQMDKTRYNGVIPSENLCINDFIISDIKISIMYISRLCIFLQSLATVIPAIWSTWFNKATYGEYLRHFLLLWNRAVVLYGQDDGVGRGHKGTPVNGLHHCLRTHRQNR